jgi:hypothetical protein
MPYRATLIALYCALAPLRPLHRPSPPCCSATEYASSVVVPTGHMVCDYIAAAMPGTDISWRPVIPQNFNNIFDAMNTLFQVRHLT